MIKLSVLPCCLDTAKQESAHVKSECCQQSSSSDSEESKSEKKACSPFFSCCSGAGFVFMKPAIKIKKTAVLEIKRGFSYLNNYSFVWHTSIFQPPQFIA